MATTNNGIKAGEIAATDRPETRERLVKAVQINKAIIAESACGILAYQANGGCILANRAAARMTGTPVDQLLAEDFRAITWWREHGLATAAERTLESGLPHSVEALLLLGLEREVWIEGHLARFSLGGEPHLLLVLNDVSASRRAQRALRDSEQELRTLSDDLREANRRYQRDMTAAAAVQRSLIPAALPESPRLRWAHLFRPAEELCGDTHDCFRLDDRHLAFYQCDVAGHGVPAAMLAVQISRLLSPASRDSLLIDPDGRPTPPHEVLFRLNGRFFGRIPGGAFFTMVYGLVDEQDLHLELASGGHCRPLVLRRDGQVEPVPISGNPVGILSDPEFGALCVALGPGDRLLIHSDGIVEAAAAQNPADLFGVERLSALLARLASSALPVMLQRIRAAVEDHCRPTEPQDDCSLLACEALVP